MEASRQENVKIKEEKEKLEARVKELEAEINAQQAVKGDSESIASNNAEATEKAAEQINAIVSMSYFTLQSLKVSVGRSHKRTRRATCREGKMDQSQRRRCWCKRLGKGENGAC